MIIKKCGITNGKKEEIKYLCEKMYEEIRNNQDKFEKFFSKVKFEIKKHDEELYIITGYKHCNFFIILILSVIFILRSIVKSLKDIYFDIKESFKIKKPQNQYTIKKIRKKFEVQE